MCVWGGGKGVHYLWTTRIRFRVVIKEEVGYYRCEAAVKDTPYKMSLPLLAVLEDKL